MASWTGKMVFLRKMAFGNDLSHRYNDLFGLAKTPTKSGWVIRMLDSGQFVNSPTGSFRKWVKPGTPEDPLEQFQALKAAPPSRAVAETIVQSLREVLSR